MMVAKMRIVDGVDRIEIGWSISDTVIDSPDQLANHETFSRNPWGHTFGHGDRAKKMYYSLRYLTKEGDEQLVGSAVSGCSVEKSPYPL
jgi:hypothetical protein